MSSIGDLRARPWIATAVAGALAAVALLVIPISYQRVVGYDVALTLGGSTLEVDRIREIAQQFKGLLRADHVTVRAVDTGRPEFVLDVTVPAGSGRSAGAVARAFAAGLVKMGYAASATTSPKKERVSGTVYAYARDRVIEINLDGKSAAQLESEIRQRLAEAGVTDARVSVTDLGGDHRKIGVELEAKRHLDPTSDPKQLEQAFPELVLKRAGVPIDGKGFTVRVEKKRSPSGTSLVVRVGQDGKSAEALVANPESMTDAALTAEIEAQLKRAGLEVTVAVKDGGVEIRPLVEK
jgi:hypothetical protein